LRLLTAPIGNQLLAALPDAALRRLLPDLVPTTLRVGEVLFRPGSRLARAYFPVTSVVSSSFAVGEGGAMAKAWPVGREGIVGISLFLGGMRRNNRADVQIGGAALSLPAAALLAEFNRAESLQHILLRYVFALMMQASQLAVCSNYHSVDQRLCRFLSRLFDRVPGDEVLITQERIGALLGVRRVSITAAASRLHAAGVIAYHRGHVRLISRKLLNKRACACAGIIKRAFDAVC